jgi:signal transduction histidine kinase
MSSSKPKIAMTLVDTDGNGIADQMQNEFINVAAHELRTPVQPILGIVEMLGGYPEHSITDEKRSVEVKIEDLQMLGRNAARLERLSSDILDVSRIESGSLRLRMESFDMTELTKDAIEDAKRQSDLNELQLKYIQSDTPKTVFADKQRIMQVITNLLSNAIRFTRPKGTISITVGQDGENLEVVVSDTGTGITKTLYLNYLQSSQAQHELDQAPA